MGEDLSWFWRSWFYTTEVLDQAVDSVASDSGSIASRLWTKPALSIIGFDAPSVDAASNTLLPRARAKFSLRLAPGQDPEVR